MDFDESSDNDQCVIYQNTLEDDSAIVSLVENINGLTLQDEQIPVHNKADRKVALATDGMMGQITDGAVTSTTEKSVASIANVAVASTADGAVAPTTANPTASLKPHSMATDLSETRASEPNLTLSSDAESPSLQMKAVDTPPGIVQNHSPAYKNHKAGPEQKSLDSRKREPQAEVSKALNVYEEINKPIHPLEEEPCDVSANNLELSKKRSQKDGAGNNTRDSKGHYPDKQQDKGLTDKASVEEFKVEEPSACDLLASQDGNLFIKETEYICKCIIKIEDKTKSPLQWDKPRYCDGWYQSKKNKRITLVLGKLCDLDARMVVIPSNGCCFPIKDFGDCFKGEKDAIMETCLQLFNNGLTNKMPLWYTFFNENTGSLPYSIICHAVLVCNEHGEQIKQGKQNLELLYKRVVEKAVEAHLNSLAIPLCDYGGPSVDDQIYALKGTIKHYLTASCCKDTLLDEIIVCVTEKKEANLVQKMMEDLSQSMEKHLFRLRFDVSEKFKGLTRKRKNHIKVHIKYGKLHEINADVLVNSTSVDLDLTQGGISKAILDAAGQEIQKECRQQKSLLNLGDFVITGPGKLKTCKKIFHGALPMWDPTPAKCEQVLKSFVKNCLLAASKQKMKSIAFPSLGTGQLKFPWHRAARTMYESVNEYERENKKSNLELIMFVINPEDEMSNEAFLSEEIRQTAIKKMKSKNLSVQQCRNQKESLEGVLRSNSKAVKIMVCEGDMREDPFDCTLIRMEKCDHGAKDRDCPANIITYCGVATSNPSQLHNEYKIHVRDDAECLYRALYKACEGAMQRRHTILSFEVNKSISRLSAGVMTEQFIKAVNYQESLEFLVEIHIFVSSSDDLENVQSHVNALHIKPSFLSNMIFMETTQFDYVKLSKSARKTSHYPQPPFTVSIRGFSSESCQEVMVKIKKFISGSDTDSMGENEEMDENDHIDSVFETVRAEMNPGFLTSCNDIDTQKNLRDLLETTNKVKVTEENGRLLIQGTLDQVLSSEKLLSSLDKQQDLKFKDDHFMYLTPLTEIEASALEYMVILYNLESFSELGLQELNYKEGCIRVTCSGNRVSELKDKISSLLSEVRSSHSDEIYLKEGEKITSILPQNGLVMIITDSKERKVILISSSTEQLRAAKHKIMVQLGRITPTSHSKRGLRFKNTSVKTDSSLSVSLDSQMLEDPTGPSKNIFLAKSEVVIKVYNIPITEANVDCIVNATDKHLRNSSGVSKAIADAAGEDFKAACAEYFRLHGPLREEAVVLLPGSLKCKYIISIAGPVKFKREVIYTALSHLENVVIESLKVADGRHMKSIAFPSVCAGAAGLEAHLCAQQYYRAVDRFIRETKTPLNLKEIHFVDINASMTQIIQATFAKHFSPQKGMASSSDASIASLSNIQSNEDCVICMETITDPKVLPRCGHTFCKECIDEQFKYKPACPCCGAVYGKIIGSQPDGTMNIYNDKQCLPGFEGWGTIIIFYEFPGGKQKAEHPHPGRPYHGTKRKAYLPDNEKGKLVLKLLREAFNRKLVFTIGASRTTGQDDTVTWNDIHHKTNITGGPQKYGYPDSTYLDRVMDELAVKGITKENL